MKFHEFSLLMLCVDSTTGLVIAAASALESSPKRWLLLADFCLPRGAENDTKLTLDKRLNQLKQNINF